MSSRRPRPTLWNPGTRFEGNEFVKNTVSRSGNAGIFLYGSQGGRVLFNRVTDFAQLVYDMGGIYSWGTDGAGTEIAYNELAARGESGLAHAAA